MKTSITRLLQLAPLIGAFSMTSCVQLWHADREFKTHSAIYDYENPVDETITVEEALNRIPAQPDFQQLKFDRQINKSDLRPPTGPYRVGAGDSLDIEVAENLDTRRTTTVMPDGKLYYDVAEGINVKGMSLKEISGELSKALQDDYVNPIVTVNVAQADSQRFWMLGQVRTPGTYPITKPTTVIDAISIGGGLLANDENDEVGNPEAADLERAILIRDGDLVPVDFKALVREGDMSQNVYIQAGDYIFIPSLTARSVYVLGEVNTPGPVFFEEGTTLLSCVAAAGGIDRDAVGSRALILRGGTHHPQVAVVNIEAIMKGREPDLSLEGGDIVWVPRTAWTKLNEYVEAVLVTAGQAVAIQEGVVAVGGAGGAVSINAGGF
ncbi:MAG: SLBB domain-containing protein [Verrucomicrobiota bacterium]